MHLNYVWLKTLNWCADVIRSRDPKILDECDIVVDVGGGVGTVANRIVKKHPHLRVVVQDLPGTIEEAGKVKSSY